MNTKKKILSLALAASIAAIAVVGSSLAYFTDKDEALNTFTVGDVDIALTESNWDAGADHILMPGVSFEKNPVVSVENGSQDAWLFAELKVNKFNSWLNLNAARYEVKDNVDYLNNGKMTEAFKIKLADPEFVKTMIKEWFADAFADSNWTIMNYEEVAKTVEDSWTDGSIKELSLILGYNQTFKANQSAPALFNKVTMPADITSEMIKDSNFDTNLADWKIDITAYGIQAAELNTLVAAYSALF